MTDFFSLQRKYFEKKDVIPDNDAPTKDGVTAGSNLKAEYKISLQCPLCPEAPMKCTLE